MPAIAVADDDVPYRVERLPEGAGELFVPAGSVACDLQRNHVDGIGEYGVPGAEEGGVTSCVG